MKRWSVLLLSFAAAACNAPPEVLPPPFGQDSDIRLFFPTGIAATSGGDLVVANGNFDHSYDASTVVTLRREFLQQQFAKALDCSTPLADGGADPQHAKFADGCDIDVIPQEAFSGVRMIGNYAGPLVIDHRPSANQGGAIEGVAYTGSRDTNRLNRVLVQTGGGLACPSTGNDCRPDSVDLLAKATLEGPYSIVPGVARVPGEATDHDVVYVAALVPHVDEISSGTAYTSATVAALDATDASQVRFAMLASSRFLALGVGVGPMVFDDQRRQLFISGCFQRAGASAAGDLTTIKCTSVANSLRVLDVDAAAAAQVRVYDLTQAVHSNDTVAMEIDTAPTGTRTVWATMRNADLLVQMNPPVNGLAAPDILRAVSLPQTPADLKIIPRPAPATSNLIAVAAAKTGDVMIYDPSMNAVVAVLDRLGDTPWKLELLTGAPAGKAWLAASIFNSCRIALMEIPIDAPWNAVVRGRAGACPQ